MTAKITKLIPVSGSGESIEIADALTAFLAKYGSFPVPGLVSVRIMAAFAAYEQGTIEDFKKVLEEK